MRVSGFTILRHVGPLGYPFVESIRSVLPLVDEFFAVIADDDGESGPALAAIGDPRIQVVRSHWEGVGSGGVELSRQTNIGLRRCTGDWAIYLQADELVHEDDHERLRRSMRRHLTRDTEGLVFDYLHFIHTYDWVANDWRLFYPSAVRVVRTGIGIESAGDAAGFVLRCGAKTRGLIKARSGARIFHYGWVGPPEACMARSHRLRALFDGRPPTLRLDDFVPRRDRRLAIRRYRGSHPPPIRSRVAACQDTFAPDAIVRSPAWFRAWRDALVYPRHFNGWARAILPPVVTNVRWRLRARRDRRTDGAQR